MSNPRLRTLNIPGALLLCLLVGKAAMGQETPTSQVTEGFVNAPVATVWQIFTTSEGYRTTGVDQASVDLRLGGTIASRRGTTGTLGDAETRVDEILSYEPQRMLTVRNRQMPASDPQRGAVPGTWTVIHFSPSGDDMTHVRIVVLGFRDTAASQALRKATGEANRAMLDHVAQRYWPKCKLCAAPDSDQQ